MERGRFVLLLPPTFIAGTRRHILKRDDFIAVCSDGMCRVAHVPQDADRSARRGPATRVGRFCREYVF